MRLLSSVLIALLLVVVASACNAPLPATPTVATTAAPPAAAASPSPEPLPTGTAAPTAEPPTATPELRALRVAYLLDGDVWGVQRGSTPVQLVASGRAVDLRLTDDGERIAYLEYQPSANTFALRSVRFDGSDDRLLIDQAGFDALYPLEFFLHYAPSQLAMIPGTHQLLFNTRGIQEGPGLAKNDDLIRVDVDSGALAVVLPRGEGGDFVLSPNGSQLAIVRPESVGFANLDGSRLRPEVLTFPYIITYSEYLYYPEPVWVGEAVMAAIPGEDPFFGPELGTLWRVPADGSAPVQLASLNGDLFAPQRGGYRIVSPDGAQVAFFRRPNESGPLQLWIYEVDSGSELLYAEGSLTWLGWAPDSTHFTYQDESTRQLVLGQLGGDPVSLGGARLLHWIDPAQFLMLLEMTDGSWGLLLRGTDGSQTELARIRGDFASSAFSE